MTAADPESNQDVAHAIGMKTGHGSDEVPYGATPAAQGLGMNTLQDVLGANAIQPGHCVTFHHNVGHKFTTCFQKFKLVEGSETRDTWAYNRYATAVPRGNGVLHKYSVKELTVRSRPWSGTKNRVTTLRNFWPNSPVTSCNPLAEINVSLGAFSAKLPVRSCSGTTTFADGGTFELQSTYKGEAAGQLSVDALIALDTWAGQELVMADYTWATFGDFHTTGGYYEKDNLWAYDTGW